MMRALAMVGAAAAALLLWPPAGHAQGPARELVQVEVALEETTPLYEVRASFPRFVTEDLRYRPFNAFLRRLVVEQRVAEFLEEWGDARVADMPGFRSELDVQVFTLTLSPRLITVAVDASAFGAGAPHAQIVTQSHLFDLALGRALAADEVFDPARGWVAGLTAAARAKLVRLDKAQELVSATGRTDFPDPRAVEAVVRDLRNWQFLPGKAVLHFDPLMIAAYVHGEFEAEFSFDELRPFLNPTGPFGGG